MSDEMIPFIERIIATGIDPLKVIVTWDGRLHADGTLSQRIERIAIKDGNTFHDVTRGRIPKITEIFENSPGLFG